MKKLLLAALAALCFIANMAKAEDAKPAIDPRADAILKQMFQTYRNLNSYEATARVEIIKEESGQKQKDVIINTSIINRPNMVRLTRSNPAGKTEFVSDGKTLWKYILDYNQYIVESAPAKITMNDIKQWASLDPSVEHIFTDDYYPEFMRVTKSLRFGGTDKIDGAEFNIIEVEDQITKSPNSWDKINSKIWIDKDDSLLNRYLTDMIKDSPDDGGRPVKQRIIIDINYSNRKVNHQIPASAFIFIPPANTKLVKEFKEEKGINLVGQPAPEFSLSSLEGAKISLKDYRGKIILLDFWATWCPPCCKDLPHIQKLNNEFKNKGLVILGINNEEADTVAKFIKDNKYDFTTLRDDGSARRTYRVMVIPTLVIIDKEGKISEYLVGYREESVLRAKIEALLK
ncbi:MAG: redoxin domain-containing protein [Planctomycetota bacterium]